MIKTAIRFAALTIAFTGLGTGMVLGAANAATPTGSVPICSRTVTDSCMNPSQAPHMARHAKPHHAKHHAAKVASAPAKTAKKS